MSIDLIRRLRKIATLESEDYGAEPQDHSSWQAADVIERQAAQIEMLREALTLIALDDCCTDPAPIAQKAIAIQPDDSALKAWLGMNVKQAEHYTVPPFPRNY